MVLLKAFINKKHILRLPGVEIPARNSRAGFTFIEILMVMALLAILGGLGLFMSMESMRGGTFRDNRNIIVSSLQRARSMADEPVAVSPRKGPVSETAEPAGEAAVTESGH